MSKTGHKQRTINGQTLVEHIKEGVKNECRYRNVPMPTDKQMAVVISQLRMHHTMEHAVNYDYSELGKPDEVTKYWPEASSVGRFFRDAAELTLEDEKLS